MMMTETKGRVTKQTRLEKITKDSWYSRKRLAKLEHKWTLKMNLANHFNAYSLNNLIVGEIEENKNEETKTVEKHFQLEEETGEDHRTN